mmetsp:Transcript_9527/g.13973  ORF Transcript_9527/g.13973 Transcript_9527/m.13973 type:complete len:332 (+) Transcript_9527:1968-2963(+)
MQCWGHSPNHLVTSQTRKSKACHERNAIMGVGGDAEAEQTCSGNAGNSRVLGESFELCFVGLCEYFFGRLLDYFGRGWWRWRGVRSDLVRPTCIAIVGNEHVLHGVILEVDLVDFLLTSGLGSNREQELGNVVSKQGGRSRGQPTGHICIANDLHSVGSSHNLVGLGLHYISTVLRSQVNTDTTLFHSIQHFLVNQHWGLPPRNQGSGDDNIHVLGLLKHHFCLGLLEIVRHFLGISSSSTAVFLKRYFQERGSHALYLLFRHGSHIERSHNGAHVLRGLDGSKTSHSCSQDQHFGRSNLTSSRHLPRKEPREFLCGFDHGTITRDVRLRR